MWRGFFKDQSKTFDVDASLVLASTSKLNSQKNKENKAGSFAHENHMFKTSTIKENVKSKSTHSLMHSID